MCFFRALIVFCSTLSFTAASPLPFDLVDLGTPTNVNSYARAINEKDEIVGVYHPKAEPEDSNQVFYWNGGFSSLPKFGERAFPTGINIHSEIVGQGFTNGEWRAWIYRDSQYRLLPGYGAESINDHSHVAGRINSDAFLISENP